MASIVCRYLFKELYLHALAIILVLLVILLTNQFVNFTRLSGLGYMTMTAVLKIMSLQIPLLLGYIIPLSIYLSILMTLGRWYADYEVVVLQACGLSRMMLLGYVALFAIIASIVVACLLLWIEPLMEKYQVMIYEQAITEATVAKVIPKRFQQLGNNGVFYAGNIADRHQKQHIAHVFLASPESKQHQVLVPSKWRITIAASAKEGQGADLGHYLSLNDGYQFVGTPGQADFHIIHFKHYGMQLVNMKSHDQGWPGSASTTSLLKLGFSNLKAASTIQWRIAMPISVLLLSLVAFGLCRINPRQGKFKRFLPAVLIYSAYLDLIFLGRNWLSDGRINVYFGLWWLHAGILLLGILLLIDWATWKNLANRVARYFSGKSVNEHH